MSSYWPPKDPDEILDYPFDWSPRGLDGDTIVTTTAVRQSGDVIISAHAAGEVEGVPTGLGTVTWLRGGSDGTESQILLRAVTTAGRTLEETVSIRIATR